MAEISIICECGNKIQFEFSRACNFKSLLAKIGDECVVISCKKLSRQECESCGEKYSVLTDIRRIKDKSRGMSKLRLSSMEGIGDESRRK